MADLHFKATFDAARLYSFAMLPKGAIVAVADLVEVVPTEVMLECDLVGDLERQLGNYSPNRFAWRFENIKRLRQPYFLAGHQGIFNVPEEQLFCLT